MDPDGVAQWSYDPANAVGALGSRCYHASACAGLTQPNFKETLAYNSDARLQTSTVDIRAGGQSSSGGVRPGLRVLPATVLATLLCLVAPAALHVVIPPLLHAQDPPD